MLCFAGMTGHAEVVRVVFYPDQLSFTELLKVFWENHDPTQGKDAAAAAPRNKLWVQKLSLTKKITRAGTASLEPKFLNGSTVQANPAKDIKTRRVTVVELIGLQSKQLRCKVR